MMHIPWIYLLSCSTNLYYNKNKEVVAGKNSDTLDGIAQSLLAVPLNYPTRNEIDTFNASLSDIVSRSYPELGSNL
jgi:hypothetical protein